MATRFRIVQLLPDDRRCYLSGAPFPWVYDASLAHPFASEVDAHVSAAIARANWAISIRRGGHVETIEPELVVEAVQ